MLSSARIAMPLAAAIASFMLPAAAGAADTEVILTPYLWASGVDGDIQARGQDIESSADFDDVVENMDVGGSAMLELISGAWVSFAQIDYLAMDSGDVQTRVPGVDADMEFDTTFATLATGYRLRTGERSTLDLMAGVRYAGFDARISIQGLGNLDADSDLYDGIVVLRPRLALSDCWYFSPTMSVGAGDTDLSWEASPQFMYQNGDLEVRIGYRNLNFDFQKGDVEMDQSVHGPLVGFGFRF